MKLTPPIDCHVHTRYSGDGRENPEAVVLRAIGKGIGLLCITDHMDLGYYDPKFTQFDLTRYLEELWALKRKYAGRIFLNVGLEVGYTAENRLETAAALAGKNLEYVIQSVHQVGETDCYDPRHYLGRTREETYGAYLNAVLESLNAPYPVHAVGHLGYVCRNAPYPDKTIKAGEFDGILHKIFAKILERDLILELNTSCYGLDCPTLPNPEILQAFFDAGGRKICFSSDAHTLSRIGAGYAGAVGAAKRCGFTHWTAVRDGEHVAFAF